MPVEQLEVENLHLWRGERHVLRGLRFVLARGACLEVCGANGSGKTTLLRALCGLVYPEEGRVLWNGKNVRADLRAFHAELAYLGHEPPLKADLTRALARVGAGSWCERRVRTLSAGQRRRVALAGLALLRVPLWLLDEPTTNLDAEGRELVGALVCEQLARGGTVVAAVHQGLPESVGQVTRLELAA
jgi:heme exporter protein A